LSEANARAKGRGHGRGLYLDLAVGTHPYGAETWEDRDSFAYGASLGAPPDAFSADGQSWGLAPFNPRALVAKGFGPLAETLRCQMALSGAVRIDHILGFDRAFWVPEGGAPGPMCRMPRAAMLAVVRMEAARAGAVVVGEDLGNVPRGLRGAGVLGHPRLPRDAVRTGQGGETPVFRDPARYPARSIASFSTHDLPTWAGWRKGHEIDARLATGRHRGLRGGGACPAQDRGRGLRRDDGDGGRGRPGHRPMRCTGRLRKAAPGWPWFRWKTSSASRRSRTCPERPASIPTGGSVCRSAPRRWPMIREWSAPPRS
jgi:4-alpha-glucanotransferase